MTTYTTPPKDWFEKTCAARAKKHRSDPELEATILYLQPTLRTARLARALAAGGERSDRFVWLWLCKRLELAFRDCPSDEALAALAKQSTVKPVVLDFGVEAARILAERQARGEPTS